MTLSRLSVLSTEEIERIHGASMRILETVGVKVDHGKAREILGASGAKVEGSRVCIPEELVRKALEQAPAEFSLYAFASFFQKLGTGAALWLMGQILAFTGYITPSATDPVPLQPLQVVRAIRIFMGPVPAVLIILAVLCAWRYPISRSQHVATLERLAARE